MFFCDRLAWRVFFVRIQEIIFDQGEELAPGLRKIARMNRETTYKFTVTSELTLAGFASLSSSLEQLVKPLGLTLYHVGNNVRTIMNHGRAIAVFSIDEGSSRRVMLVVPYDLLSQYNWDEIAKKIQKVILSTQELETVQTT